MALKTLEKFGVKNGCIHFEAKSKPDGTAVPIEVNLRMGLSEIYLYSKLVWGVDLIENAARIALGLPVIANKTPKPLIYLVSYRFLSDVTCRVMDINVDKVLYSKPYFIDLYFETPQGKIFKAPPDGYDHSIGILTVKGNDQEEVERNLQEALTFIKIATIAFNLPVEDRG